MLNYEKQKDYYIDCICDCISEKNNFNVKIKTYKIISYINYFVSNISEKECKEKNDKEDNTNYLCF